RPSSGASLHFRRRVEKYSPSELPGPRDDAAPRGADRQPAVGADAPVNAGHDLPEHRGGVGVLELGTITGHGLHEEEHALIGSMLFEKERILPGEAATQAAFEVVAQTRVGRNVLTDEAVQGGAF